MQFQSSSRSSFYSKFISQKNFVRILDPADLLSAASVPADLSRAGPVPADLSGVAL